MKTERNKRDHLHLFRKALMLHAERFRGHRLVISARKTCRHLSYKRPQQWRHSPRKRSARREKVFGNKWRWPLRFLSLVTITYQISTENMILDTKLCWSRFQKMFTDFYVKCIQTAGVFRDNSSSVLMTDSSRLEHSWQQTSSRKASALWIMFICGNPWIFL